jgi:hypothetical protein
LPAFEGRSRAHSLGKPYSPNGVEDAFSDVRGGKRSRWQATQQTQQQALYNRMVAPARRRNAATT